MRLKYAAGNWTTVATCPAAHGTAVAFTQGGVLFGDPVEKDGEAQLPVAIKAEPDDYRVVAIDPASHEHPMKWGGSLFSEGIRLHLYHVPDLRLGRVKEFRLQTARAGRRSNSETSRCTAAKKRTSPFSSTASRRCRAREDEEQLRTDPVVKPSVSKQRQSRIKASFRTGRKIEQEVTEATEREGLPTARSQLNFNLLVLLRYLRCLLSVR